MFAGLVGWVLVLLIVGIVLLIGGIALPIIVPMMIGYTQGSQDVITTGTPFMQFLIDWWPVLLPVMILFAIVVYVLAHSKTGMGGGV